MKKKTKALFAGDLSGDSVLHLSTALNAIYPDCPVTDTLTPAISNYLTLHQRIAGLQESNGFPDQATVEQLGLQWTDTIQAEPEPVVQEEEEEVVDDIDAGE